MGNFAGDLVLLGGSQLSCFWFAESWGTRRRGQGAGPGEGAGLGRADWSRWGSGRGRAGGGAAGCAGAVQRPQSRGLTGSGPRTRSGAESGLQDLRGVMAACPGPAGAGAIHAAGPSGFAFDSDLEIKTRSVEQTLLPLVSQVKRRPERSLFALPRGPRWRRQLARPGRTRRGGRQLLPHIPRARCGRGPTA